MDFGWPAAPTSAGGACSDLNLLQDGLLIDLDDKTLQCLMGGPSAGFATCISSDPVLPGEAASGSGTKRDREEEIAAADDDDDSEDGGNGSGGGGTATRGPGRPPKKGKAAAEAASAKATREKKRREKLNECFEELARLCDPAGKMARTDRISIVQDAIRTIGVLRVENNQLHQLNKFLEERVRHLEAARGQGMLQQHMMQQMAMQQQQMAMQQQMQQPMAGMAHQQAGQLPAAQHGEQQQQQPQAQAQLAPTASGALPTASSGGELQPAGGSTAQQQAQQVEVAQQAQQAAAQQAVAQQVQQGTVVPPGMMLVPIPAGGAQAMPAQPYPAAHPYYGMKAEASMDPGMTASGSGTVGMANGGYMMAPVGMAPSMGVAPAPAMGSLPQVMPPNAPPVSWLPAPDISQDGKLRPPAA